MYQYFSMFLFVWFSSFYTWSNSVPGSLIFRWLIAWLIQWIVPVLSRSQYTLYNPVREDILNIDTGFRSKARYFFLGTLMRFCLLFQLSYLCWQHGMAAACSRVSSEGGGNENHLNGGNNCIEDHQCRASCEYLDETFNI